MARKFYCDKCKKEIDNSSNEIVDSFSKIKYDLCRECYKLFKKFIGEAPQQS